MDLPDFKEFWKVCKNCRYPWRYHSPEDKCPVFIGPFGKSEFSEKEFEWDEKGPLEAQEHS